MRRHQQRGMMSILVVEKSRILRGFFAKLFDYWQVESKLLQDYEEALALAGQTLAHTTYTHLLLEISDMAASRQVLEKLKQNNPGSKAIALCNDPFQKRSHELNRHNFDEILVKPFRVEELKKALDIS